MVLQYNKRDLPKIVSVTELDEALNPADRLRFETVAREGVRVFDALRAVAKMVVDNARKNSP